MNIRDVMTPNPRTVTPDDTIQSAARIMRDEDTGAVPVVENGRPSAWSPIATSSCAPSPTAAA